MGRQEYIARSRGHRFRNPNAAPVSLPKREYMENAKKIWEELGLPKLRPQMPWFGYSLGQWDEELDHEAELAVQGRHFETGEKLKAGRVKAKK